MNNLERHPVNAEVYSRAILDGRADGRQVPRPYPNPTFEWATYYVTQGLGIIPIPYRAKAPTIRGWPQLRIDKSYIQSYFDKAAQNIGVMVGEASGGLVDIDLDSDEAIGLADHFLPKTNSVFGRVSKPKSHRLYICPDAQYRKFAMPTPIRKVAKDSLTIVEIRTGKAGKGIQTVFPPSIHTSGEPIEWSVQGPPANINANDLETAVSKIAAAALMVYFWRNGIRHDLTLALAGTLLRNGWQKDEVVRFVQAICKVANDDEVEDRLKAVSDTAKEYSKKKPIYGIPKLTELISRECADPLLRWLNIERHRGPNTPSENPGLQLVCMADVEVKDVEWLWKPLIPIGEFTIIEGAEEIGKTWLACAIVAPITRGNSLPFDERNGKSEPGTVLFLTGEDSLAHTLRPRLEAVSAELDRVKAMDQVFSLGNDLDLLWFEEQLERYRPTLVILDPVFSYAGGKDLNSESSSRPIARKLIGLAQKYNCAIIGFRHIGKSKGMGDPRNAGLGSISWRASARSVLLVGEDPETGIKAICQTKSNLAERSKIAIGFEIKNGQFLFLPEPVKITAEQLLKQAGDADSKIELQEAVDFLREMLQDGERPSKELSKEAKDHGISTYLFRKAKTTLRVESFKKGGYFGGENNWYLRLPGPAEVVDIRAFRHLQSNDDDKTSYDNGLAEDVGIPNSQQVQAASSTSSTSSVSRERLKATCVCGEAGELNRNCRNCGESIAGNAGDSETQI